TAFKYGKAKSLAPICNGTATFIKPRSIGVAAKKIIIVPCVVNTSRSEEHTSELQSRFDLVCRPLLEKKKKANQVSAGSVDLDGTDWTPSAGETGDAVTSPYMRGPRSLRRALPPTGDSAGRQLLDGPL